MDDTGTTKDGKRLKNICAKLVRFAEVEALTTKDGKKIMALNKAKCHEKHEEKVNGILASLSTNAFTPGTWNARVTIHRASSRTDLPDWNHQPETDLNCQLRTGLNYLQDTSTLEGNCSSFLEKIEALKSNSKNRSSLKAAIREAGGLACQVVSKLNTLDKRLQDKLTQIENSPPENGKGQQKAIESARNDWKNFSEAKKTFVQLAGQLKQLAEQCSVDLPELEEALNVDSSASTAEPPPAPIAAAATAPSEIPQTITPQEKAQAKLDQLKVKREECNKKFDALCGNHQAALDAFSALKVDDQKFKDELNNAVTGFDSYKNEQFGYIDATETIGEYSAEIEKLGSGDVEKSNEICNSIGQSTETLNQYMPKVSSEFGVKTLNDLRYSAAEVFRAKVSSFQNEINADLKRASDISTEHAQTAESLKNAMVELFSDKKLPQNIQNLYDDFAKASQEEQVSINFMRQQTEGVVNGCRDSINEFENADVRSNHDAIGKFANARDSFQRSVEQVDNTDNRVKTQQKECEVKLNALKAELMKTPEGFQVLMNVRKAQMDQSIGVLEDEVNQMLNNVQSEFNSHPERLKGASDRDRAFNELFDRCGSFQSNSEPIKLDIANAYRDNAIDLKGSNGECSKSYETFEGVCQKSQLQLDDMLRELKTLWKTAELGSEDFS